MTTSTAPVISVCIANYNGADCLGACIESVLAQRDSPPFEIIVHDDASTDGSAAIAAACGGVRLLASDTNVGFCVGNNRMVAESRGEYVLLLNNDAVLLDGALRTLCDALAADAQLGIVTLTQLAMDGNELLDRGMLLDPFLNPVPVTDPPRDELAMVMGSCLATRRSLWLEIGGFPEFFESIGEDMYLCLYARMLGYRVACAAASGYRHRVGNTFGGGKIVGNRLSSSYRRRALSERNKTWNMVLFYPLLPLLLLFPAHALGLIIEGCVMSLARRGPAPLLRIYVPALRSTAVELPRLWRLRRHIHVRALIGAGKFFSPFRWVPWKLLLLMRHGLPRLA